MQRVLHVSKTTETNACPRESQRTNLISILFPGLKDIISPDYQ